MITWAFIFKEAGCSAKKHHVSMDHNENRLLVYGVDNVDEGVALAKRLVEEDNCTLIELCGGFGPKGANAVTKAVDSKAQVGYVIE